MLGSFVFIRVTSWILDAEKNGPLNNPNSHGVFPNEKDDQEAGFTCSCILLLPVLPAPAPAPVPVLS